MLKSPGHSLVQALSPPLPVRQHGLREPVEEVAVVVFLEVAQFVGDVLDAQDRRDDQFAVQ